MTDDRIISADPAPGETHDRALRPQTLSEFVGQEQAKGNLKVSSTPRGAGPSPWITSCCSGRRGWARPH